MTHGFARIDAVTLGCHGDAAHPGDATFTVQGEVDASAHLRAEMSTGQALRPSPAQMFRALDMLDKQRLQPALRRGKSSD